MSASHVVLSVQSRDWCWGCAMKYKGWCTKSKYTNTNIINNTSTEPSSLDLKTLLHLNIWRCIDFQILEVSLMHHQAPFLHFCRHSSLFKKLPKPLTWLSPSTLTDFYSVEETLIASLHRNNIEIIKKISQTQTNNNNGDLCIRDPP